LTWCEPQEVAGNELQSAEESDEICNGIPRGF